MGTKIFEVSPGYCINNLLRSKIYNFFTIIIGLTLIKIIDFNKVLTTKDATPLSKHLSLANKRASRLQVKQSDLD